MADNNEGVADSQSATGNAATGNAATGNVATPNAAPRDGLQLPEPLKPCGECGGAMATVDVAGGDDRLSLIRDNFGKYFSRDSLVPIERAQACLSCGYTRFFVDPEKLRKRATPRHN